MKPGVNFTVCKFFYNLHNVNLSAEVVKTARHVSFSNQSTLATFLCQSTTFITTAAAATVDDISAV